MNGADPIGRTQVFALITGDCHQGQFAEDVIERHDMREVETTVESRDGSSSKVPDQRAVQKIDVKMQNVKLFRSAPHFFKHNYVIGPVETRFLYSKEFPLSRICTQKSLQNRLGGGSQSV